MPDISNISLKAGALSNLILVTPNTNRGIEAEVSGTPSAPSTVLSRSPWNGKKFLFHYEGEQTLLLESDITDHYVEDNTSTQDHIAIKPVTITTHGYIGELNDVPSPALQIIKSIADKLTMLAPFNPQLSVSALVAYNNAVLAYNSASQVLNAGVSSWNSIVNGGASQNLQQLAYNQFYAYWKDRTLFTVQSPWAIYSNMAIKSLRATQDEDTRMISTFEVSFKQMRFANTRLVEVRQGRNEIQSMSAVDHGLSSPVDDISLSDALSNTGLGVA